jgi:hypothetical protein
VRRVSLAVSNLDICCSFAKPIIFRSRWSPARPAAPSVSLPQGIGSSVGTAFLARRHRAGRAGVGNANASTDIKSCGTKEPTWNLP